MRLNRSALMAAPAALAIILAGCSAPEAETTPPPATTAPVAPETQFDPPAPTPEAPEPVQPPVAPLYEGPDGMVPPGWAIVPPADGPQWADARQLDPLVLAEYGMAPAVYYFADATGTMCADGLLPIDCHPFETVLEAVILSEVVLPEYEASTEAEGTSL